MLHENTETKFAVIKLNGCNNDPLFHDRRGDTNSGRGYICWYYTSEMTGWAIWAQEKEKHEADSRAAADVYDSTAGSFVMFLALQQPTFMTLQVQFVEL